MQNTTNQKLLLFQVGPVKCSLFSNDIQTIIPPPKHETAGKTGRLPGMFRHSDRLVRVVDVRTKFGLSPSDPTHGRVIIAELPQGIYAFWVDKVLNVIDQEDGRWDILPAALPRDVFTRTFIMDKELILHTECVRLEAMVPSTGLAQHIEQLEAKQQAASSPGLAASSSTKPEADNSATPTITKPDTAPPLSSQSDNTPGTTMSTPSKLKTESTAAAVAKETPPQAPPSKRTLESSRPSQTIKPAPPRVSPTTSAVARPTTTTPRMTRESATTVTSQRPARPTPTPPETIAAIKTERDNPQPVIPQGRSDAAEEDEGGGIGGLILIVAILFIAGSAAILYFSGAFSERQQTRPVARYEEAIAEPAPEPAIHEPVPIASEPQQPALFETEQETIGAADTISTDADGDEPFRADINRQDRVLTITLNGPNNEAARPLIKERGEQSPDEARQEPDTDTKPEMATSPAEEVIDPIPVNAPIEEPVVTQSKPRLEVTHVVVKGDTLWDIAERYVKDPFRYPELAHLSGIKNPDKIYPGDTVHIIEK
ncbi:MAG: chemotaxis protein CheW [Gammaproteobacteria bacterium]|nr:chemotaxis protein CheW [Gammaproteobacteria bacterium]